MRSQQKSATVAYETFDAEEHLRGVAGLLRLIGWDNFRHDPGLTRRSLTAPGVTAVVAVGEPDGVVGFAQVFDDGGWRRGGIGRRLVEEAFARTGAVRMDLIASDESLDFYRALRHREQAGFRVYPARGEEG